MKSSVFLLAVLLFLLNQMGGIDEGALARRLSCKEAGRRSGSSGEEERGRQAKQGAPGCLHRWLPLACS